MQNPKIPNGQSEAGKFEVGISKKRKKERTKQKSSVQICRTEF